MRDAMHGHPRRLARVRRLASLLLTAALLLAACGNPTPSGSGVTLTPSPPPTAVPSPTPTPTPTPVPTPVPTLPPLDGAVFGAGWTVASGDTNVGEKPGVQIRSTIGPVVSLAIVCAGAGAGTLTVTLMASGGDLEAPTATGSTTVECPQTEPQLVSIDVSFDYHGVLIDPQVTAPPGVEYIVLVGTHG